MAASVLVTGATGTVGSGVLDALIRRGVAVRAGTRHPASMTGMGATVEPVRFDFTEPSTFADAFVGVETMFLVRPPALTRLSDLEPALHAAAVARVRHVVLLSVQGAEKVQVLPHAHLERWLRGSTMAWTFLRPSFFDQNLLTVHGPAIRRLDELVVPAGRGRVAFVDALDVAEAAAAILAEPDLHRGRAYTLTGAEALSFGEVAGILTAVCERNIRYRQPGLLQYLLRARRDLQLPPSMVAATTVVYTTARLGLAASLSDDLDWLLERPPTSLTAFVHRERQSFAADLSGG